MTQQFEYQAFEIKGETTADLLERLNELGLEGWKALWKDEIGEMLWSVCCMRVIKPKYRYFYITFCVKHGSNNIYGNVKIPNTAFPPISKIKNDIRVVCSRENKFYPGMDDIAIMNIDEYQEEDFKKL